MISSRGFRASDGDITTKHTKGTKDHEDGGIRVEFFSWQIGWGV
jgi:hypothetical protein